MNRKGGLACPTFLAHNSDGFHGFPLRVYGYDQVHLRTFEDMHTCM
jgi:hypothetical protein